MIHAPKFIHRTLRVAAFTLVEMLVVSGIIIIMLGASLPALRGFTQTENRHSAVSAVMATLDRARMMAIADGQATYVVFLGFKTPPPGGVQFSQINPNALGRAYAIFEDKDNVNFLPVQRTAWMYLPNSMAFKVDASNYGVDTTSVTNRPLDITQTPPLFPLLSTVLASGSSNTLTTPLPYLKFDSTGMVDESNPQYLRVMMFPGSVSTGGAEASTQVPGKSTDRIALLEEIDVNLATGRARYVVNPASNLSPLSTAGTQ